MTLRYDPFISLAYNESYGAIGWNTWNDENILKLAVLGSPSVDAITTYPVGGVLNGTWSLDGGVTLNGQGGADANGVKVIIDSPGQGVFSGKEGQIAAIVDNTYKFYQPTEGMVFYNKDNGTVLEYRDSAWTDVDDFGELPSLPTPSCAYPLDDDGSTAVLLGYSYAGPATGHDLQTMSYTTSGGTAHILCAADVLTTANFAQPVGNDVAVEAVVTQQGTTVCSLVLAVISEFGAVTTAKLDAVADGDVLAFTVTPSGVVSAYVNGVYTLPLGFVSVGATDKFAFWLEVNGMPSGQSVIMTLRTNASDMTGTYPSGATDICGNPL